MQFIKKAVSKCKPKATFPFIATTTGLGLYYLYYKPLQPEEKEDIKQTIIVSLIPIKKFISEKKKQVDDSLSDPSLCKELFTCIVNICGLYASVKLMSFLFTRNDDPCSLNRIFQKYLK